jgi:branched-chain amino acid transport system substrate-binding protein
VRTKRWLSVLVVVLIAAGSTLAVTGGAGATTQSQVQGIDGTTIKVGGMFDALTFAGADDGFQARVDRANKDKELGKYQIDYIGSTDVGSSADKALQTAQNLVEREQVFAVAPIISSAFQQPSATYMTGKKVPYYGAGFTSAYCSPNKYGISFLACAVSGKYGYTTSIDNMAAAIGKPVNKLNWALVGLAIPDGQSTVDSFAKLIEAQKGKVVYDKAVIPQGGGGDLQPFVSAVMDTNPDVVWVLAGAEVLGFTSAMKAAGYTGTLANSAFYVPGLLERVPSLATVLADTRIQATSPILEETTPYGTQMKKDFGSKPITFGGEYAYMAADLMIATLKKAAPNFDKIVPTMSQGFQFKPAEGGQPLKWPAAYDESVHCGGTVQVAGAAYEVAAPWNCDGKRVKVR